MKMRTKVSIVTLVGVARCCCYVPWPLSSRPGRQTAYDRRMETTVRMWRLL